MNRRSSRALLKVDATAVQERYSVIVLYNFSLPSHLADDNEERQSALERVKNLIVRDFKGQTGYFKFSASYFLKNTVTGATKFWHGSFFASQFRPGELSTFETFDPETFVGIALAETDNVVERLRWTGDSTDWELDQLESVLVNFQCRVPNNFGLLRERRFFHQNERKSIIFPLP